MFKINGLKGRKVWKVIPNSKFQKCRTLWAEELSLTQATYRRPMKSLKHDISRKVTGTTLNHTFFMTPLHWELHRVALSCLWPWWNFSHFFSWFQPGLFPEQGEVDSANFYVFEARGFISPWYYGGRSSGAPSTAVRDIRFWLLLGRDYLILCRGRS